MLITIPAAAVGSAAVTSVLDLEPLLAYAHQCRPDAISLMPPPGADDLPNGVALLAMRNRFEAEGFRVVAGSWVVPGDAPVQEASWQAQSLFEVRALLAALGEAGVGPLILAWRAVVRTGSEQALSEFLSRLLDETERSGVRLAVQPPAAAAENLVETIRALASTDLGVCYDIPEQCRLGRDVEKDLRALGNRLFALSAGGHSFSWSGPPAGMPVPWASIMDVARQTGFAGPVLLQDLQSPVEYASAVGFFHGLRAGSQC